MRDATRESADGLHAPRLLQIRFQALAFALERFSCHRIGDGIARHTQQCELRGGGYRSGAGDVEAKYGVQALFAAARDDEPTVESRGEEGVAAVSRLERAHVLDLEYLRVLTAEALCQPQGRVRPARGKDSPGRDHLWRRRDSPPTTK